LFCTPLDAEQVDYCCDSALGKLARATEPVRGGMNSDGRKVPTSGKRRGNEVAPGRQRTAEVAEGKDYSTVGVDLSQRFRRQRGAGFLRPGHSRQRPIAARRELAGHLTGSRLTGLAAGASRLLMVRACRV
jgi:hypothetical protein